MNVMASSDVLSPLPSTVVESYQFLRSSIDKIFDDLLRDQDADMNSIDKAFTWLENLSDSLSIWAVDARVRDASLLKLEGTSVGRSLLALFVRLTKELMPSQRLLAAFPPDGKGKRPLETTSVVGTTSQSHSTDLELVLNLLYQLQDSIEPIRQILATHQTGPHYATDKQIEEIYTNVREKRLVSAGPSESDKSNKEVTPTATGSERLSEASPNFTAQSTLSSRTGTDDSNKSNEGRRVDGNQGPRVKIYESGHRQHDVSDTGYATKVISPWSVEERSPLDYIGIGAGTTPTTTIVAESLKLQVDEEPYEIITANSKPRYTKSDSVSDRKKDTQAPNQRKKVTHYVVRTPESPGLEAEIVPTPSAKPSKVVKDDDVLTRTAAQILQQKLDEEPENTKQIENSERLAKIKQLEADIQKMRLERQIAEGRAAEAERRLKQQQQIEDLERRNREFKRQIEEQQCWWPPGEPTNRSSLWGEIIPETIDVFDPCIPDDPFLAPILAAQRDEAVRRSQEAQQANSEQHRPGVKDDSRSSRRGRRRRGDDDRYV